MRKYNRSFLFIIPLSILLVLISCQDDKILNQSITSDESEDTAIPNAVEGIIRLKLNETNTEDLSISLKSGTLSSNIDGLDSILNAIGAISFKRTFPYSGKFEQRTIERGMHLWYDITYDTCEVSLSTVIDKFENLSEVEKTEPIRIIVKPSYSIKKINPITLSQSALKSTTLSSDDYPFSDPYLSAQWHYYNDGTVTDAIEGADINLFDAWLKQKGSADVIVAIVDGGIDYTHEDLADNVWINSSEDNGSNNSDDDDNGYNDDVYGYNFVDDTGTIEPGDHGTHVAGTVAAVNGNDLGLCGIAGGDADTPGVRLMSCQVFSTDDRGNEVSAENFGEAIKYAADNGAVICQNSWGYDGATYLPESMQEAIDYFIEYAGIDENGNQVGPMSGGIMIFAAGNDNSNTNAYPAMYDEVVAVSAISADYTVAYYSNYGSWVDISAPGGVDSSDELYDNWVASTVTGNEYAYLIGTSMACPHVSGVAALILSEYGEQGYTPEMLKTRLYYGAVDVDQYNSSYLGDLGYGMVNASATLSELNSTPPEKVYDLSASASSNDVSLTWTVTSDEDDIKPTGYKIYYSDSPFETDDISSSLNSHVAFVNLNNVGDLMTTTITDLNYSSSYYFSIAGYDVVGSYADYSDLVSANTGENQDPIISASIGDNFEVEAHEEFSFYCTITEPNDDTYSWTLYDTSGNISTQEDGSIVEIIIDGLGADPGDYQASFYVADDFGGSSQYDFKYTVLENHAPVVNVDIDNQYIDLDSDLDIDLSTSFYDEDGEDLEYEIDYSSLYLSGSLVNNKLSITPVSSGLSSFSVIASDARGESATISFLVMARDDSNELDIYPNPVSDVVNFRMGEDIDGTIEVAFYNDNSALVKELSLPIATFTPAQSDISDLASGQYLLKINYNNQEFERNIVKL